MTGENFLSLSTPKFQKLQCFLCECPISCLFKTHVTCHYFVIKLITRVEDSLLSTVMSSLGKFLTLRRVGVTV